MRRKRVFNVAVALVSAIGVTSHVPGSVQRTVACHCWWSWGCWSAPIRWLSLASLAGNYCSCRWSSLLKQGGLNRSFGSRSSLSLSGFDGRCSLWGPAVAALPTQKSRKSITKDGLSSCLFKERCGSRGPDTAFIAANLQQYPETFAIWQALLVPGTLLDQWFYTIEFFLSLASVNHLETLLMVGRTTYYLNDISKLGYSLACIPTFSSFIPTSMRNRTINYHELRGRGSENQLNVLGALRILYKTAFCRDMPWAALLVLPRDLQHACDGEIYVWRGWYVFSTYNEDDLKSIIRNSSIWFVYSWWNDTESISLSSCGIPWSFHS